MKDFSLKFTFPLEILDGHGEADPNDKNKSIFTLALKCPVKVKKIGGNLNMSAYFHLNAPMGPEVVKEFLQALHDEFICG